MTDEEQLLHAVVELLDHKQWNQLLELMSVSWDGVQSRPPSAFGAEACRLAMLASAELDSPQTALWRARALSHAARANWQAGIGSLLMGLAFSELRRANDDYRQGKTLNALRPSAEATGIIQEMKPFIKSETSDVLVLANSPTRGVLERQYYENLGHLLLIQGSLDLAENAYRNAFDVANNIRGSLKCQLSLHLVRCLGIVNFGWPKSVSWDAPKPSAILIHEVAEATESAGRAASDIASHDLSDRAQANAAVMRARGLDVSLYAIL